MARYSLNETMFWWAIALALFLGPILLAQAYLPVEWHHIIFDKAFLSTSFWVALIGVLSGWLITQLHQMLDIKVNNGWRERDRRADVVHRIRVRLFIIIGLSIFMMISLVFLSIFGTSLPENIRLYVVGIPFGVTAFFFYAAVSILIWFRGISRHQRQLIRDLEQKAARESLIKKLREATFSRVDDAASHIVDGQLHH